jgi:hypothetical protein
VNVEKDYIYENGSPEKISGLPNPSLYDQYYINKYSFPKGLIATKKAEKDKIANRKSLYDIKAPNLRKGISGWKLTRRPHEWSVNNMHGSFENQMIQNGKI